MTNDKYHTKTHLTWSDNQETRHGERQVNGAHTGENTRDTFFGTHTGPELTTTHALGGLQLLGLLSQRDPLHIDHGEVHALLLLHLMQAGYNEGTNHPRNKQATRQRARNPAYLAPLQLKLLTLPCKALLQLRQLRRLCLGRCLASEGGAATWPCAQVPLPTFTTALASTLQPA